MNKFTYEPIHPCCNLIIWDMLVSFIVALTIIGSLFLNLSTFLVIILAIIVAFIPVVLLQVPYLKYIIHILFSVFYAYLGYGLLDKLFEFSESPLWQQIIIALIIFIITLIAHVGSAGLMDLCTSESFESAELKSDIHTEEESFTDPVMEQKIRQCINQYEQAMALTNTANSLPDNEHSFPIKNYIKKHASDIIKQVNKLQDAVARYNKSTNKITFSTLKFVLNNTVPIVGNYMDFLQDLLDDYNENINIPTPPPQQNIPVSFFQGCDTLESLNKRYKDLVKVYHPDSGNGNDKVFIEITEEYERLKPSFEQ